MLVSAVLLKRKRIDSKEKDALKQLLPKTSPRCIATNSVVHRRPHRHGGCTVGPTRRAPIVHASAHRTLMPSSSRSVIFLDIDGVICCNMAGRLEESKLAVLNAVVKATDAKVVLSTDWRRQAQLKRQVIAALKRLDIEVIGATRCGPMFQPIRPQEIFEWYKANAEKMGIQTWVAIDDRDLLNEHGGVDLQGHMCRTHPNTGLTRRLGEVCIEILCASGPPPNAPKEEEGESKEQRNARIGGPSLANAPAGPSLSATAPARVNRASSPARSGGAARSVPAAGASQLAESAARKPTVPTSFATSACAATSSATTNPATASAFGGANCTRAMTGLRTSSQAGAKDTAPLGTALRGSAAPRVPPSTPSSRAAPLTPGETSLRGPNGTPSTRATGGRVGRTASGVSPARPRPGLAPSLALGSEA